NDKDRGVAWTKYVLNYIVNGDNNGREAAVINRINNVFNQPISNNRHLTIGESFGLNLSIGESDEIFNNFINLWRAYILALGTGNLSNNKYALNLYKNVFGPRFNTYDNDLKRIFNAIFYIGGDDVPPLDKPFD